MATSKNFTTSNQFIVYAITATESNVQESTNKSDVSVSVRFWRTNTGYISYGTGKVYCRINGTLYSQDVTPYDEITSSGIVLFSRKVTITHNPDGAKTISISAWIDHEVVTSKEQSFSVKLTTIARASTPSVNAKSTSVSSVTIGDKITIYSNRASTSFTHTAKWKWDGRSGTIGTNIGASTTWTIPSSFVDDIPNASYGTLTIELETFSGGKSIGTKSTSVKAYAPNSLAPVVGDLHFEYVNSKPTVESWGVLLQGFSKVKITADVETKQGASIKTYSITGGGYTGNTKEYTTGLLNTAGNIQFTYKVTDTRGFSASNTGSVTVEPYSQPLILDVTCYRSNAAGEMASDGQYVFVRCRPQFASCNNRNSGLLVTRVSGVQGSIEVDNRSVENNTAIQFVVDGGMSASGSYTIYLELTDLLGQTARYSTIFPTDNVHIHLFPSSLGGVKFGGYLQPEEEGYFVSEYPSVFKKPVDFQDGIVGFCGATAYLGTDMGVVNTNKQVPLDKILNSYGGMNLSGNGLKIPYSGYYIIDAQLMIADGAQNLYLGLLIDSKNIGTIADSYIGFVKGYGVINCNNTLRYLESGDIVYLTARCSGATNGVTITSNTRTKLTIFRVF